MGASGTSLRAMSPTLDDAQALDFRKGRRRRRSGYDPSAENIAS
jgi:hypothetical protein